MFQGEIMVRVYYLLSFCTNEYIFRVSSLKFCLHSLLGSFKLGSFMAFLLIILDAL
jgi:hypothetical protein